MAGIVIGDINNIYLGANAVKEVYAGADLVWPVSSAVTYVIVASSVVGGYYDGSTLTQNSYILANGFGSYAVKADVQEYHGSQLYQTLRGVFLWPQAVTGADASHFHINGQTVQGDDLEKNTVYNGYSATVTWKYRAADESSVTTTVTQQENTYSWQVESVEYTGYSYGINPETFVSAGGTVYLNNYLAEYTEWRRYTWTSGATDLYDDIGHTETQKPTTLVATSGQTSIAGVIPVDDTPYVVLPQNIGTTDKVWNIVASWTDPSGTTHTDTVGHTAQVLAPVYTYGAISITTYSYPTIPASGGTVRPTIEFSLPYYIDGVYAGTLTGSFSNGATSTTVSSGNASKTVSCAYQSWDGSVYVTDTNSGAVIAASRGYNEDAYDTEVGVRRVGLTYDSEPVTYSEAVSVKQARNYKTEVSRTASYSILLSLTQGGQGLVSVELPAGGGYVYLVGGTYTQTVTYSWQSLEPNTTETGSRSENPDDASITPTAGTDVDLRNLRIFIPANTSFSQATYQITASYNGAASSARTARVAASTYTFARPVLSFVYMSDIPASGGTLQPNVFVTQTYGLNGATSGVGTLSGTLLGGTSGSLTDSAGNITGATFSVAFSNSTGSVTAQSKGKVTDPAGTVHTAVETVTATATTSLLATPSEQVSATAYQQANFATTTGPVRTYTGYSIALSATDFGPSGGQATVTGEVSYTDTTTTTYTSNAEPDIVTTTGARAQDPSSIAVVPSTGVVIQGTTITFPANTSFEAKDYTVGATYENLSDEVVVSVAAQFYTYGLPVVTIAYAEQDGWHIQAAGGTVYPTVSFTQVRHLNGIDDAAHNSTISGSVSGASSGTASDGSAFSVSYSVAGANGGVTAGSKGSIASGITNIVTSRATVVSHGSSSTSAGVIVKQEANERVRVIPESYSYTSVKVDSFSVSGSTVTSIPSCLETTVTAVIKATWSVTSAEEQFTAYDEGDTSAKTGGVLTTHSNEVVSPSHLYLRVGSSGAFTDLGAVNTFTAENTHSTSSKTYYLKADYGTVSSAAKSISQAVDTKVTNQTKDYVITLTTSSNDIWAGGGTAVLISYAYHTKFSYWKSGGVTDVVEGTEVRVDDTATVTKVSGGSSRMTLSSRTRTKDGDGYYYSRYTVTHADMTNNVATDTATFTASTNGQNPSTPPSQTFSATNALGTEEYTSYGAWSEGTPYTTYSGYGVSNFSISAYTSDASPASQFGATASYTAIGQHSETVKRVDTRDVYTDRRYSSWSAEHDDSNHRERTTTQQSLTNIVSGPTVVTGDAVTVSSSASWVTVDQANNTITFAAQSSGGRARSAVISAVNANGGQATTVTVYQEGYKSVTASVPSLSYGWRGGSQTFVITADYATWTLAVASDQEGIVRSLSGTSGGNASLSNQQTTVYVVVYQNDVPLGQFATLRVTPSAESGLEPFNITISQEPYNGGL